MHAHALTFRSVTNAERTAEFIYKSAAPNADRKLARPIVVTNISCRHREPDTGACFLPHIVDVIKKRANGSRSETARSQVAGGVCRHTLRRSSLCGEARPRSDPAHRVSAASGTERHLV